MENRDLSENRQDMRKKIPGFLPGEMLIPGNQDLLKIHPVDISSTGLGLIINRYLPKGTKLLFKCGKWVVSLEVVWCQKEAFMDSYRRCGLISTTPGINLINLVTANTQKP